ncbi:Disease resistance protein [Corchorus olitorius]|uniref:Disease resistance protein n=1 Tax=Corchorus olitorius TaxID=93759 RepID=A0A1R3KBV7_9ROSI|nr:Disease resistance protein [Corchorus olitorius]
MNCIKDPTCTYLHHHRKLEANVNHLKTRLNKLNARKQDVESRIEAEIRRRKVVKKEVETWLQDVQRMDSEMQEIEEKLLSVSYFSRARLGKLVCRRINEVKEIYQQGNFLEGVAVDGPPATGVALQTTHLEGEIDVKEQIWRYLMGNDVGMIALCGMGGIGKTTIMKHINNQLLKETTFDNVIWITVSKEFNVFYIQGAIARALDQSLPEDELVLKVKPLSKVESLNLFVNRVGYGVLQVPTLMEIVHQIVEQCCGLPLAIVTTAGTMKGVDDVREWRNALNELCRGVKSVRGSDNEIFDSLMFSYDRLRDPKIQNCFLYCSLYPEDFAIERKELAEKWIEEGFIDECGSRQAMHDRGHSILNKLEDNCLLERVDYMEGVKMHDLLRDMALSIKSIGARQFMVKSGMSSLKKLPSEQEWTGDLDKVSLMRSSISEIPPHISPKCHNLSTLLLQGNRKIKSIPESFFRYMCGLRVLDLSYTGCAIFMDLFE